MDPIVIKGAKDGLRLSVRPGASMEEALAALRGRLAASASFFEGAAVRVQCEEGERRVADAIMRVLSEHGVRLAADDPPAPARPAPAAQAAASPEAPAAAQEETADARLCRVITGTLRSGQRVSHAGDIVLVGDCNPGCELVAGGHIFVMGVLRGSAHAGATGDASAMVCAFHLQPTSLRIAGVRADVGRTAPPKYPETAALQNGSVVIAPYLPNRK